MAYGSVFQVEPALLRGIIANQPREYRNNTTTVDAVGRSEVHIGFVNHYYLFRFIAEQGEDFPVRHNSVYGSTGSHSLDYSD